MSRQRILKLLVVFTRYLLKNETSPQIRVKGISTNEKNQRNYRNPKNQRLRQFPYYIKLNKLALSIS